MPQSTAPSARQLVNLFNHARLPSPARTSVAYLADDDPSLGRAPDVLRAGLQGARVCPPNQRGQADKVAHHRQGGVDVGQDADYKIAKARPLNRAGRDPDGLSAASSWRRAQRSKVVRAGEHSHGGQLRRIRGWPVEGQWVPSCFWGLAGTRDWWVGRPSGWVYAPAALARFASHTLPIRFSLQPARSPLLTLLHPSRLRTTRKTRPSTSRTAPRPSSSAARLRASSRSTG